MASERHGWICYLFRPEPTTRRSFPIHLGNSPLNNTPEKKKKNETCLCLLLPTGLHVAAVHRAAWNASRPSSSFGSRGRRSQKLRGKYLPAWPALTHTLSFLHYIFPTTIVRRHLYHAEWKPRDSRWPTVWPPVCPGRPLDRQSRQ